MGDWKDETQNLLPGLHALSRPALRPYQSDGLKSWKELGGRGIVALPTGSGKTILAVEAILSCGGPALILVPTRALLSQWRTVLKRYIVERVGIIGDGEFSLEPITVSTFEGALRRMDQIGNRFSLLVVDEVHHFGAGVRDEALAMCTASERLGLSATPVSPGDQAERLSRLMGPTVFSLGVSDLTGKYLAMLERSVCEVKLTPPERVRYERCLSQFKKVFVPYRCRAGPDWGEFVKWANTTEEGRRALLSYRSARQIVSYPQEKATHLAHLLTQHRESQTLIFTFDVPTAHTISREFLITPITSHTHRSEREEVLANFRRGKLRALVSCRVLNEGLDVPDAEVAIIVGGTAQQREHVQRVGRCLRPALGKVAKLYELVVQDSLEVRQWKQRSKALAS